MAKSAFAAASSYPTIQRSRQAKRDPNSIVHMHVPKQRPFTVPATPLYTARPQRFRCPDPDPRPEPVVTLPKTAQAAIPDPCGIVSASRTDGVPQLCAWPPWRSPSFHFFKMVIAASQTRRIDPVEQCAIERASLRVLDRNAVQLRFHHYPTPAVPPRAKESRRGRPGMGSGQTVATVAAPIARLVHRARVTASRNDGAPSPRVECADLPCPNPLCDPRAFPLPAPASAGGVRIAPRLARWATASCAAPSS